MALGGSNGPSDVHFFSASGLHEKTISFNGTTDHVLSGFNQIRKLANGLFVMRSIDNDYVFFNQRGRLVHILSMGMVNYAFESLEEPVYFSGGRFVLYSQTEKQLKLFSPDFKELGSMEIGPDKEVPVAGYTLNSGDEILLTTNFGKILKVRLNTLFVH